MYEDGAVVEPETVIERLVDERTLVMKGLKVKLGRPKQDFDPDVNLTTWARETAANLDCQDQVDTKAFTGRGNLLMLRQQVDRLEEIEARMAELVAATKAVSSLSMHLMIHRKKHNGYVFLRWRDRSTARHLNWAEASAVMEHYNGELQMWCETASLQAHQLNDAHLRCRDWLRTIRKEIKSQAKPVFARPINAR